MTDGITDLVLERADEGYLLLGGERTVLEANPAAGSLLGVDGSLAGADVGALPEELCDLLADVRVDEEAVEAVEVAANGERRFVEAEVVPVEHEGDGDRLVLLRDASGRVERNRYRGILEASGDAVYALDPDGRYTYTNRANTELLGYDESEMIGAHVSEILDAEEIERIEEEIMELLRGDGPGRTVIEHDVIARDGRRIPVANHISILRDEEGEFRGTAGVVRDVTERKEREEQLERYERIVEAMGDGVYVLDEEGRYLAVNDYVLEMTGYEREDFIGNQAGVGYSEEDREKFERAIRELLDEDGSRVKTVEALLETADGDSVPIEVNLTVLTSEEGEFRGTVGVVRDVTERKEREQELERYETLLNVMPDTVVVTDTEGRHSEIHGFEGWSGYTREELIGEPITKTTPEEDAERATEAARELFTNDDLEKVTYEQVVITKDGEHVPMENHLTLLPPDEDGWVPGTMSVLRNITERKAREQALEALSETTRELVAAESREAVVEKAVRTANEVLDLPLTGVWLYDEESRALVPASYPEAEELPDDPPTFRPGKSVAWEAFEAGQTHIYDDLDDEEGAHNPQTRIRSEIVVPLGDHGVLVSGSTDAEVFDEKHRNLASIMGAAVGTAFDRLDRELEREEQRRELRRKNERLEEFASVLSHDLRNPLNVAHARVRNAMKSGDVAGLSSADAALTRMNELIEDLLALAREGQAVGDTEPVSLRGVANDSWESVEAPDASLSVEGDATFQADRARLIELFGNLYRNAVEHAGPSVEVRVGVIEGDDSSVGGFYVEDDGPGVPPEQREEVFDRGVTGSEDGTGYGLAIVREIAEAHGWSVSLSAGDDGGARFEFALDGSPDGDDAPAG